MSTAMVAAGDTFLPAGVGVRARPPFRVFVVADQAPTTAW